MKYCSQNFSFPILKTFTVIGITTFALLCSCLQALAQWRENFSDGEITTNPEWGGNTDRFTVVNNVLQLNAPAVTGSSDLTTASEIVSNCTWTFSAAMSFNPSGSNYARVYLASDSPDLSSSLNGYYVMIGGTGDEISLYRQEGATRTRIIDGPDGQLNVSAVNVRIKVIHDDATGWALLCDNAITGSFVEIGSSGDAPSFSSGYFGIQCVYTATRSTGFSFDDIETEIQVTEDETAPSVTRVMVPDSSHITITLSEPIEESSSLQTSNYILTPIPVSPTSAILDPDLKTVSLSFSPPLENGMARNLSISGIRDIAGNEMEPFTGDVMYFRARPHYPDDIVFTEVFPDPSPVQSLPEDEFVEIMNRSATPIQLRDWVITDGSTRAALPDHILTAGKCLILTRVPVKNAYEQHGATVGLPEFPSLNNSGDMLILIDGGGVTIDSIVYAESWYHDSVKKDGGWTIEIIDPDNLCGDVDNWSASMDARGGTPGKLNSVDADNADLTPPKIDNVVPIGTDTIRITWSEKLDRIVPSINAFSFTPTIQVKVIQFSGPSLRQIDVVLASPLTPSTQYALKASGIQDCAGNTLDDSENFRFALPERAEPGDIVINEILFNPKSTGVDFVELWNASEKFVDLSTLRLAKPMENGYDEIASVTSTNTLISPGEFLVVTTQPGVIESEYIRSVGKRMIKCGLPSLPDDGGAIALLRLSDTLLLDAITYTPEMHNPFLEDFDGVSLERISVDRSIPLVENWKSAARSAGYATPGEINSNFRADGSSDHDIHVTPESFAPREGQFTQIWYLFRRPNLVANVNIFDSQGRSLKTLAKGELLGTSGFMRWDGDSDEGDPLRTGVYMIVFEVFDSEGVVSTIRKRVAIGAKF